MIVLYFALIVGLSIYDIWRLKNQKLGKDIVVFIVSMVLVAAFGYIYLSNTFRPSLISYLLDFLKIGGI